MSAIQGILHDLGQGWTAVEYPSGFFVSGPSVVTRLVTWATADLHGSFTRNIAGHIPVGVMFALDQLIEAKPKS